MALPPPAARTTFQEVAGQANPFTEARWTVAHDSPLVTAWPFIQWDLGAPPARASAPRSKVVGAILVACRQPPLGDMAAMRAMDFLTHDMAADEASGHAHVLDVHHVLDQQYPTFDLWKEQAPNCWANLARPTDLRLQPANFRQTEL